ncbi:MAG: LacI family transcriptional regulator [Lacunisphaera sp.]|nr:LacI family transcriptional regulator [Lacunisphaera sp.]
MSGTPPHVTLTQVAKAAGVAVATASYALRNHPKIRPETKEHIQATARRLGYRPNPRVAALMAHIRQAHSAASGDRLALLWIDSPRYAEQRRSSWYRGARKRADQLGYLLEEFWLDGVTGMTASRIANILHSRGIVGLVISPLGGGKSAFSIEWDWSRFAPAIIGNARCTPELHHAGHHHFAAMHLTMLKLAEKGHRKIYALLDRGTNERSRRAWSAAFLQHHPLPKQASRFLGLADDEKASVGVSWLKGKKDAEVLITTSWVLSRLRKAGYRDTGRIRFILLDWQPNSAGYGGIDQAEEIIAANAVDLAVSQLHHNERGIPDYVKMVLFPGIWREDGTGDSVH